MDCFLFAPSLHAAFLGGFFLSAFFLRTFFSLAFCCELFSCELFCCELFCCELLSLARLFSSPWSLYLRIVLDRRDGCAVIAWTGLLLRLLTDFLVLF